MALRYRVRGFEIYLCQGADLMTVSPPPTAAALTEYYNSSYEIDPKAACKRMQSKAPQLLNWLEQRNAPGRLLEVGCSYGYLLLEAEARGWTVTGVEPSTEAAEVARKSISGTVINGTLEDVIRREAGSEFDAAVMLHVIEHVPDPEAELRRVAAQLKADGLLILATPNIRSLQHRLLRRWWEWVIPPAHLWYFSQESLSALLDRTGFEVFETLTRRGDSIGLVGGAIMAPGRMLQALVEHLRQSVRRDRHPTGQPAARRFGGRAIFGRVGHRVALILPAFLSPLDWITTRPREAAYHRMLGPELVVFAHKRANQ